MKIKIRKENSCFEYNIKEKALLSDTLIELGYHISLPCGGAGICGRCIVKVTGDLSPPDDFEKENLSKEQLNLGYRLACRTLIMGDVSVELPSCKKANIETNFYKTALLPKKQKENVKSGEYKNYGVAVDLGTTTLAVYLFDIDSGILIKKDSAFNPQMSFGADVISRIVKSGAGQKNKLAEVIRKEIDNLIITSFSTYSPKKAVITGNTPMLYFLTGREVSSIASAPFKADCLFGYELPAESLGMKGVETIYLPHCIGAFIGADLCCAVLSVDIIDSGKNILVIDIGTNGELYLHTKNGDYCCSVAAGPAFEGGGIEMGMNATEGAIYEVFRDGSSFGYNIIGDVDDIGICGSGIIDAVAVALDLDIIDETGLIKSGSQNFRFHSGARWLKLSDNVALSQNDIRALQLSKGAVRAAVDTLLMYSGLKYENLDNIIIAGGFGTAININSAVRIGLLPHSVKDKTYAVGNAASAGAARLLLDENEKDKVRKIAENVKLIELSDDKIFSDTFLNNINFNGRYSTK